MISYTLNRKEKLSYFMSGKPPKIYAGLLFAGIILLIYSIDLESIKYASSETVLTDGVITKVFEYYSDEELKLEYIYSYEVNSETYTGSSFSTYEQGEQGKSVRIEYIKSDPAYSKIQGSDFGDGKIGFMIAGVVITLAAFIGFGYSLKKLNKLKNILTEGNIVKSFKAESEATSMYVNDEPLYEITYHYEVNQVPYKVFSLSSHPSVSRQNVNVLYSCKNPGESVLLGKLSDSLERKIKNMHRSKV